MSQYAWTIAVLTERATCRRAASMISTARAKRTSSRLLPGDLGDLVTTPAAFLRGDVFPRCVDVIGDTYITPMTFEAAPDSDSTAVRISEPRPLRIDERAGARSRPRREC
jgi:hypothetical protein